MRRLLVLMFAAMFAYGHSAGATTLPVEGGPGGAAFEVLCPAGQSLIGLAATSGDWINSLTPLCAAYSVSAHKFGALVRGRTVGGSGGSPQDAYCPPSNNLVRGLGLGFTKSGSESRRYVDSVNMHCSAVGGGAAELPAVCLVTGDSCVGPEGTINVANRANPAYQSCPPNEGAVGIHGRSGESIDALGLVCAPEPGRSIGTARLPSPPAKSNPWSNALRDVGNPSFAAPVATTSPAPNPRGPSSSAEPPSYALVCSGGAGMQAPATTDGFVRIFFRPSAQAASGASPHVGECAWLDRGFRSGEPQMLVYRADGRWSQDLLTASRSLHFRVDVYNNGQGAMVVTGFGKVTSGAPSAPSPAGPNGPNAPRPVGNVMKWGGLGSTAASSVPNDAAKRGIIIVGGKRKNKAAVSMQEPTD